MIDWTIELALTAMSWAMLAAWRALPILAIVFVVDLVAKKRIAPRFHCLFWMIVIVRLACPFSVETTFSMHRSTQAALDSTSLFAPKMEVAHVPHASTLFTKRPAWMPVSAVPLSKDMAAPPADAMPRPGTPVDYEFDIVTVLSVLLVLAWPLVAIVLVARLIVMHLRFWMRLRRCETLSNQASVDLLLRVTDAVGVGRRPAMKLVPELDVPAVFGLFRPTICLPANIAQLSDDELSTVLTHEVAHIKRKDTWLVSFATLVRAVQWPNPLAWIALAKLRTYVELGADDVVIRCADTTQKAYGDLLLRFASGPARAKPPAVGLLFSAPGKSLAHRIKMLGESSSCNHPLARVVGVAVLMVLAATGLTDGRAASIPIPQKKIALPVMQARTGVTHDPQFGNPFMPDEAGYKGPEITRELDARPAIEQVRKLDAATYPEIALLLEIGGGPPLTIGSLTNEVALLGKGEFVDGKYVFEECGRARLNDGVLTVTAPKSQVDHVERQLERIAAVGLCQLVMEMRFASAELDVVNGLNIDWQDFSTVGESDSLKIQKTPLHTGSLPVLGAKISEQQVESLRQRCESMPTSNMRFGPKVTLFNGQVATVVDETKRAFVTNVRGFSGSHVSPVVDAFPTGVRVDVVGEATKPDRTSLKLQLTYREIMDVALANLPTNGSETVTIQVPQIKNESAAVSTTLLHDESLLIAIPTPFARDELNGPAMAKFFVVSVAHIHQQQQEEIE